MLSLLNIVCSILLLDFHNSERVGKFWKKSVEIINAIFGLVAVVNQYRGLWYLMDIYMLPGEQRRVVGMLSCFFRK